MFTLKITHNTTDSIKKKSRILYSPKSKVSILSSKPSSSHYQRKLQDLSTRRRFAIKSATTLLFLTSGFTGAPDFSSYADRLISTDWEKIEIPVTPEIVLMDIGFVDDMHGFIIGTKLTLLETNDGGKTWITRDISANLDE